MFFFVLGDLQVSGSAFSCSWFLDSCPLWKALFSKCGIWLIKLSNFFHMFNQLTSFGLSIKDWPFARTDFWGVINIFDDRLIVFWWGPSFLAFLILSFRLSFTLFLFSLFFSISYFLVYRQFRLLLLLLFSTQRLSRSIFCWCLRLVFFLIIWILRLMFVLLLVVPLD